MRDRTIAVLRLIASFALIAIASDVRPADATLAPAHFVACRFAKVAAHCGTVTVYENRATRVGRTIALRVVELDAKHRSKHAIFWNPGGPGVADFDYIPAIASGAFERELSGLRERYDIVFVDNRGTGESHPLNCSLYTRLHPDLYYAQLYPDAPLRACRAARANATSFATYTTDVSADDLDDVRSILGYPKIVLDGGSYGTMFFLDYARRHAEHVESLVLQGVAPPGFLIIPLEDARGAQDAMNGLITDCAQNASCHAHFPKFGAHFAALIRRFDLGPVPLRVMNAVNKREQTVRLSKEVLVDQIRHVLYDNEAAAYVPYIVEQSFRGNDAPLARLVDAATAAFAGGATGLQLSVTCAEDLPFLTEAMIARTSAHTFMGDSRVRAQQHACSIWNVPAVGREFVTPVRSTAPVLMISGAQDPATPPEFGRAALRYLPNGRQIVIPHATHEIESACTDALIVTFVTTRNAKRLDAGHCIGTSHRPAFATSMNHFGE